MRRMCFCAIPTSEGHCVFCTGMEAASLVPYLRSFVNHRPSKH